MHALAKLGDAMSEVDRSVQRLLAVEGVDGRPLAKTEGVDPNDADAWMESLMELWKLIPVWRNTHVSRSEAESRDRAPSLVATTSLRRQTVLDAEMTDHALGEHDMTPFSTEDLAAWAERKRVRAHLTGNRADPRQVHMRRIELPRGSGRCRSLQICIGARADETRSSVRPQVQFPGRQG